MMAARCICVIHENSKQKEEEKDMKNVQYVESIAKAR